MRTQTKLSVLAMASLLLCYACGGSGGGAPPTAGKPGASPGGNDAGGSGSGGGASSGGACPSPMGGTDSGSGAVFATLIDPMVLQEIRTQGLPGMTLTVAKNGAILYSQGYGYADLATCQPMPANAEMEIGSLTKQFTAAAVLQLYSVGTLDIDKPLITYLPAYAFDLRITLRMLLNQTSGLQDYLYFPELAQYSNGALQSVALNAIAQRPLNFTPGTAFGYSNSNYFILGSVIEAVTSGTYADYLASHILIPAGLSNTFYQRPGQSALPYVPSATGAVPGRTFDPSVYFAAGALWSTVQDLSAWDAALFGSTVIVSQSSRTLMLTPPAVPIFQSSAPSPYGMGLVDGGTLAGHPFVWHDGQTVSYTSFNGVLTDDGFSISILTNFPTQTSLLSFAERLIESICNSEATASSC
ncbi:MAG TPA: serine hydrolase domain-containing protein [Steroidobacteraceae bacterium]